jgi:hypothetical protein
MRKPYLLALALALLAALFGWRTQQALDAPVPAGDNASRAAAAGWQPGAPVPDPPPPPETAAAVAAVKNRPLFRSDRRPYTEMAAAAAPARNFEAELSRLSLIGVLSVGEEMRGVVVSKGGAGSARAERWEVKAGDDLPGFKVKEVRTDGLAVTAEGREFLLPLYAGPPVAGAAARTEAPRRETAPSQPAPAQPAAPAPVQPPRPAAAAPVAQPPATTTPVPGVAPRYIPGRR